ncbi:MAG: RIP metalloprotease RseP [Gammaproteobacteria bacterium]|nr:RIP metalloprotease RseP [Gammaproteobacteria bacterium]
MDLLLYPLALIVMLGVLVTFHEFGHFVIARMSGVRVVRFSVGFGKPIWSRFDKHGTEFAIAAIPLGGYLRMLDDRDSSDSSTGTMNPENLLEDAGVGRVAPVRRAGEISYNELDVWWRIAIAFGGPVANFLLAIGVYWLLFVVGTTSIAPMLGEIDPESPIGRTGHEVRWEIVSVDGATTRNWQQVAMALAARLGDTGSIELTTRVPGSETTRSVPIPITDWHRGADEPDLLGSLGIHPAVPPVLGQVLENSAAQAAGLKRWDQIITVDNVSIDSWSQWVEVIQQAPATNLTVLLSRDGREMTINIRPEARQVAGGVTEGYLGVALFTNEIHYGFLDAIPRSLEETLDKTVLTLGLLKKMVTGQVSVKNLSGPIYIAKIAGDSARSGWRSFVGVLALLSISLGVLNLLPIPILDGGHILFCVTEIIIRKPVPERAQAVATQFGLFVFVGIFLLVIYNDISRLL